MICLLGRYDINFDSDGGFALPEDWLAAMSESRCVFSMIDPDSGDVVLLPEGEMDEMRKTVELDEPSMMISRHDIGSDGRVILSAAVRQAGGLGDCISLHGMIRMIRVLSCGS